MTDTHYDRAPGDGQHFPTSNRGRRPVCSSTRSDWLSRWSSRPCRSGSPTRSLLWAGGVSLGLTVLAIAQMGVHLVFFLHVTTGRTTPTT